MPVTNRYIAKLFKLAGQLLELHEENQFKARSYDNAYFVIRQLDRPISEIPDNELEDIQGIGKTLAARIKEIKKTGSYEELDRLLQLTPPGLIELVNIKGLGAKKTRSLWKELHITSPEELLKACEEGRVASVKGFGAKTQESLVDTIHFYFESKGKWLYAEAEHEAMELLDFLEGHEDVKQVSFIGAMRRKMPVIDKIEILLELKKGTKLKTLLKEADTFITADYKTPVLDIPVVLQETDQDNWVADLVRATGNDKHLELLTLEAIDKAKTEESAYKKSGLPYIIPEMREGRGEEHFSADLEDIVEMKHLRGCIHNHSLWSDGGGTIEQMAQACMDIGLEYFGISDHSQTAAYAGGLPPKKVLAQMKEVDKVNEKLAPFKVFKGIESDILADGSLDYDDDILKLFDYVVASVHSGQKMTEKEANARLIRAIENPYTTILGHMTARLLLIRRGFPVDFKKIIDACADNGVVIEINANPRRLDMDWQWYDYAMKKDVMLSINPDAHDMSEIPNMYYGVCVARKGGVTYDRVLNALSLKEIEKFFNQKKSHRP